MERAVINNDIAWLAGMIESEGSISFQTLIRKNGNLIIVPFVRMTNSDKLIIDEVIRISGALRAEAKVCKRPNRMKNKFSNKDCYNVSIEKMERVTNIIRVIHPYLRSRKKLNAEKVLDFIQSRKKGLLLRNELGQIVRSKYKEEEIELVASVRTHKRAMTLERMLQAPNVDKEGGI